MYILVYLFLLLVYSLPVLYVYVQQSFGLEARKVPSSEIEERVADCVTQGYTLLHSYDDVYLVHGYGR